MLQPTPPLTALSPRPEHPHPAASPRLPPPHPAEGTVATATMTAWAMGQRGVSAPGGPATHPSYR